MIVPELTIMYFLVRLESLNQTSLHRVDAIDPYANPVGADCIRPRGAHNEGQRH